MEKLELNLLDRNVILYRDFTVWGNGEHETTQNVLELVKKYITKGNVLDIGTGTGIQSIYAALLGASHVLAVDNDAYAVEYARKNFRVNKVNDICEVEINELNIELDYKADLIIANLPPNESYQLLSTVENNMNDGAILILTWFKDMGRDRQWDKFEVIEKVEGIEFDEYVLRRK